MTYGHFNMDDEVVSTIAYHDCVLIFTKKGKIFKLKIGAVYEEVMFRKLDEEVFPLK